MRSHTLLLAAALSASTACASYADPAGDWTLSRYSDAEDLECDEDKGFVDNLVLTKVELFMERTGDDTFDAELLLDSAGEIDHFFARPYDFSADNVYEGEVRRYLDDRLLFDSMVLDFDDVALTETDGDRLKLRDLRGSVGSDNIYLRFEMKACMGVRPCTGWMYCRFKMQRPEG